MWVVGKILSMSNGSHQIATKRTPCSSVILMISQLKRRYVTVTPHLTRVTNIEYYQKSRRLQLEYLFILRFFNYLFFICGLQHWNVKEMFARHLLRMKGLSVHKTVAILQRYPTVDHLNRAYFACTTDKQRELLLAPLFFGTGGRKIGPSISRKLYRYYSSNGADLPA